jgi:hypothetical protein
MVGGCAGTRFGCCDDAKTGKADDIGTNCDEFDPNDKRNPKCNKWESDRGAILPSCGLMDMLGVLALVPAECVDYFTVQCSGILTELGVIFLCSRIVFDHSPAGLKSRCRRVLQHFMRLDVSTFSPLVSSVLPANRSRHY